jgi:hypothetical protein
MLEICINANRKSADLPMEKLLGIYPENDDIFFLSANFSIHLMSFGQRPLTP